MTPSIFYQETLWNRLIRLQRYESFKQDGHGRELDQSELRLVEQAIKATRADWLAAMKAPV